MGNSRSSQKSKDVLGAIEDEQQRSSSSLQSIDDYAENSLEAFSQDRCDRGQLMDTDKSKVEDGDWYDLATFTSKQRFKGDTVALRRTTYIHLTTISGQEEETGRYTVVNFDSDGESILSTLKGRGLIQEMFLDELVGDSLVRLANDRPLKPGFDERLTEVRNMDKHSFEYALFFFNCESFANYLRSGVPFSGQVWSMNKTLSILTIVSIAIAFLQKRRWNNLIIASAGAVTFYAHDTRLINLKKIIELLINRWKVMKMRGWTKNGDGQVILKREITN